MTRRATNEELATAHLTELVKLHAAPTPQLDEEQQPPDDQVFTWPERVSSLENCINSQIGRLKDLPDFLRNNNASVLGNIVQEVVDTLEYEANCYGGDDIAASNIYERDQRLIREARAAVKGLVEAAQVAADALKIIDEHHEREPNNTRVMLERALAAFTTKGKIK